MTTVENHRFPGVFRIADKSKSSIATQSIVPGQSVYGERVLTIEDKGDFRIWNPRRSKLAAAIQKGVMEMPIQPGSRVLYLGAASGTTVSHCSDIVGPQGVVYAVEFSARTARGLLQLAESRGNIVPIIEDARHPTKYAPFIAGPIDVVYQDIAQPNQARILSDNIRVFCGFGAWGLIAIKARSIDSTAPVDDIYSNEIATLDSYGLEVIENLNLEPLERDHRFLVCRVTEGQM
ncbi:MAG: fibrillarin-like rRNA/tRNA 2'-O-methyltransferase [Candidatus Thorarchaeota archaeon]|jgi:fibrillarin-like rRNA methylase